MSAPGANETLKEGPVWAQSGRPGMAETGLSASGGASRKADLAQSAVGHTHAGALRSRGVRRPGWALSRAYGLGPGARLSTRAPAVDGSHALRCAGRTQVRQVDPAPLGVAAV